MITQEFMVRAASVYTTSVLALLAIGSLLAQDITFTNQMATITNLEGRVYTNVTLVKANKDGLIWRGDGMGLIPYTKLNPALLESLGVPTNRIWVAAFRAEWATRRERMEKLIADVTGRGIQFDNIIKDWRAKLAEKDLNDPRMQEFIADFMESRLTRDKLNKGTPQLVQEVRASFNKAERAAWNEAVALHSP
jgi:hypothetical protein